MPTSDIDLYADQLNIETPEQVDLHFPVAGVGSRFIAVLLDIVFQIVIYVVLALLLYVTDAYRSVDRVMERQSDTAAKWVVAGFILLNFVLFWGYFALFEAYWHGQTPGKRIMKLRVLKDSGRSITLFEAMARNLVRAVDYFPGFYLVGLIAMLCNKRNKRLGDFVAGTIVVHERMDEQPLMSHISRTFTASIYPEQAVATRFMPKAQEEWAAGEAGVPADAVARLSADDLHVIETVFSRALDLSIAKREELGAKVAERMSAKMGFPRPEGMRAEQMLELIAHKMRSQGRN
jgi:uncharacterized RDD family membrane protein YckC